MSSMPTHTYRNIDATALASLLGTDAEPFVLDVREPDEAEQWSIPGSVNVPLGSLEQRIDTLPTRSGDRHGLRGRWPVHTGRGVARES